MPKLDTDMQNEKDVQNAKSKHITRHIGDGSLANLKYDDLLSHIKSDEEKTPHHIAIIMDGNRRWAKSNFMPAKLGHKRGAELIRKIAQSSQECGVKFLTLFAFSSENWGRVEGEVGDIINILNSYLDGKDIEEFKKNNVRLRIVGNLSRFPDDLQLKITNLEQTTQENTGLNLTIALSYGGRDEILYASQKIAKMAVAAKMTDSEIDNITTQEFEKNLQTHEIPDVDLLIRTGSEMRISNFLLWKLAYSELYFTDRMWPEFSCSDFLTAIIDYQLRDRRYGKR